MTLTDIQAARVAAKIAKLSEEPCYLVIANHILALYPDGDFGPDGSDLAPSQKWVEEVYGATGKHGQNRFIADLLLSFHQEGMWVEKIDGSDRFKLTTRTQARALFTALGITERKP